MKIDEVFEIEFSGKFQQQSFSKAVSLLKKENYNNK